MVGWLIGIGLLLLLFAVLLLPLTFQFDYDDPQQRRFYRLSWMGISLLSSKKDGLFQRNLNHQKPEKKVKEKKNQSDQESESDSDEKKVKRYFGMAKDAIAALPKPLRRMWKGFFVRKLVIGIQVGRFDAKECAVAYGMMNAAVYASLGLLQDAMHVKLEQVTVQCAFGQEKNRYVLRGVMRFCPLAAVIGGISFVFSFLWKQLRRMMKEKQQKNIDGSETAVESRR